MSRLATWYLPKIPQALSAPSWPRRAPASLSQGRGRTQLASTEHPSLISSTTGPAALLADPDPWTNLTSCFSASTGLSAPLCSGPLHELCSVSTTLSHTPDTAHLWFILRSGQMSSPERDLSHLTRGPHGTACSPRHLCCPRCGSCPNEDTAPSREGAATCPLAHHSGLSMPHLLGVQCLWSG